MKRPLLPPLRHGRPWRRALLVLLLLLCAGGGIARAATFTVNSADDHDDGIGADITLREAILAANAAPGEDTINFVTTGMIQLNGPLPAITDNLTISSGLGTVVRRNAGGNYSVFAINAGATVTLEGLTITNGGNSNINYGGAIRNLGTLRVDRCILTGNNAGFGGAIGNDGTLTVNFCTISNNTATFGGAIANGGTLIVNDSTFNANTCTNFGGAIYNNTEVTLNQCTLTDNQAALGGGALSDNNGNETYHINHCTIAKNRSLSATRGGGIDSFGSTQITVTHTILSGNTSNGTLKNYGTNGTPPDLISTGYNLSDDAAAGLTGTGDVTNSSTINLGNLANNGGPTLTMMPQAGSAAIDAGDPDAGIDEQDQRGFVRLLGARIDIGAVETGGVTTVTTLVDEDDGSIGGGAGTSLREAIKYAEAGSTIDFNPSLSGKTIVLTHAEGSLLVSKSLGIDATGLGVGLTLSGNHSSRIFAVEGASLRLWGLTLTAGAGDDGSSGGAIRNGGGGTLTLADCTLSGNATQKLGGAIENRGTLSLKRCTLNGNVAESFGGAIFNDATVTLNTCTLTDNQSASGGGALADNDGNETFVITHCTIAGNRSLTAGEGGGLDCFNSTSITLSHTILAGNTAAGTLRNYGSGGTPPNLISNGYNLSDDASAGLTGIGDLNNVPNFSLAPLARYGGRTATMALHPGSPAIDAGDPSAAGNGDTDQRGIAIVDTPDIGAFEAHVVTVNTRNDELDTPSGSTLSLREALRDATPGSTIAFAFPIFNNSGGLVVLESVLGELAVGKDLIIDATANGMVIISGNVAVLHVLHVAAGATVHLLRLRISDGIANGGFPNSYGGGIFNEGALALTECRVDGNKAYAGGGIYNASGGTASLSLLRCSVSGNAASYGGGIQNEAPLVCTATTFTENSGSEEGGAISAPTNGSVQLVHNTISANIAGTRGGGIRGLGVRIANSIVANNSASSETNFSGTNTLTGQNLVDVNVPFGSAGVHGGQTLCLPLPPGSAARNAATGSTATTDQRGFPMYDTPDIGAFESQIGGIANLTLLEDGTSNAIPFLVGQVGELHGSSSAAAILTDASLVLGGAGSGRFVKVTPIPNGNGSGTAIITDDLSGEVTYFTVTVTPVNDPPAFDIGQVYNTLENSGANERIFWATNLNAGPDDESGQVYSFNVSNDNNALFSVQPNIDSAGTLTFTPATDMHGVAKVSVSFTDSGGTDDGGVDTSAAKTFILGVRLANPVNTIVYGKGSDAPGRGQNGLPTDALLKSFNSPATDNENDLAFVAKWTSAMGATPAGTGLFLNNQCLAIAGGEAAAIGGTGAKWRTFTDPVVSAGHVASIATMSNGKRAVVSNLTGIALEKIALTGDVGTPDGAKFKAFKSVAVSDDYIAFTATLAANASSPKVDATSDDGLWVKEGSDPLRLALREGQTVATGKTIKSIVSLKPGNGSPGQGRGWLVDIVNPDGAEITALVTFQDNTQGIVVVDVGNLANPTIISQGGTTGAGSPLVSGIASPKFQSYGVPARNGNASTGAVFRGALKLSQPDHITAANASGIFAGRDANGFYAMIARAGSTAGTTGAKWSLFKDPVLAADGGYAFPAVLKGGGSTAATASTLWWQPVSGSLAFLARAGVDTSSIPGNIPAGLRWKAFSSLAIAADRGPLFVATVVPKAGTPPTTPLQRGLWAADYAGMLRTLFRTGDKVGGKKITGFNVLNATAGSSGSTRSINDIGMVIWRATYPDKSTAIVRTEIP